MKVAALAGGIGAGKFLRGMARVVPGDDLTVILNVADDIVVHGLHVSPDPDSVTYWLGDAFDRERGWGRRDESFRATDELRAFGAPDAWFNLGDLDLAAHVMRSSMLRQGATMSQVVARVAERFGVGARLLPVTDDRVETRIDAVDARTGERLDLHFQEYWVQRRASDAVKSVQFVGVEAARPAPGVLAAIEQADVVVLPPSNPVVSLGPILAVRGVRDAVGARRPAVVGVSGIVGGAPLAGMADKLMPAVGLEVTAAGAATAYLRLLGALGHRRARSRAGGTDRSHRDTGRRHRHRDARRRRRRAPRLRGAGRRAVTSTSRPPVLVVPVQGVPEVRPGDDLAAVLDAPLQGGGRTSGRRRRRHLEGRLEGREPHRARRRSGRRGDQRDEPRRRPTRRSGDRRDRARLPLRERRRRCLERGRRLARAAARGPRRERAPIAVCNCRPGSNWATSPSS